MWVLGMITITKDFILRFDFYVKLQKMWMFWQIYTHAQDMIITLHFTKRKKNNRDDGKASKASWGFHKTWCNRAKWSKSGFGKRVCLPVRRLLHIKTFIHLQYEQRDKPSTCTLMLRCKENLVSENAMSLRFGTTNKHRKNTNRSQTHYLLKLAHPIAS